MIRGTMFHVVTDPDSLGYMDEEDFYDDLGALGVDYVENSTEERSLSETKALESRVAAAGFPLAPVDEEYLEDAAFAFSTGPQDDMDGYKQEWFREDLAALKRKVAALDLKTFACGTTAAYDIRELADNGDSDAVYLDTGTGPAVYTLDAFIRNLEPDRTYYVDRRTVLMH